jgi:hypothetical protein
MEKESPVAETTEQRWFSVAGVAIVLTALALLAGYLDRAGHRAGINLVILLGASAMILGAGVVLEKLTGHRTAGALVAGGLASFYFTSFAGYYFPHLRLIDHPVAGCALMAGVTILIFLAAEKWRAQIATFFVVILAGYATALEPTLWITLFSDVVLVGAACWLLVRHGRVLLVFVTLAASYLSYGMWWRYHDGRLDFARYLQLDEFWQTCFFFAACWLVVVAGTFLTSRGKLGPGTRLILLSLNHTLFLWLVVFVLPPMRTNWLCGFSIVLGAGVIGAGALASRQEPAIGRPAVRQGVLLILLGLFTAMTGLHLTLVVAITAALLLVTAQASDYRWGQALRLLAAVMALIAVLMAFGPVRDPGEAGRMIGIFTGLVLVACACLARHPNDPGSSVINWHAVFFAALGMALWLVTIVYQFPQVSQPPLLVILALALTISLALVRVPELPYLAKGFVLAALILWLAQLGSFERPWWNSLLVVVITLVLSRWWQTRGAQLIPKWELVLVQVVAALGVIAVLFFWLEAGLTPGWWLVAASLLSVTSFFYGILTRDWAITALGQAFSFAALFEFSAQLSQNPPPSPVFALMPVAMFLALGLASERARVFVGREWIAIVFYALAVLTFIAWIMVYIPADWRFISLEVYGFALLIWARVQRKKAVMLGSLVFTTAAVLVAWIGHVGGRGFHFQDLLAFALLLLEQQLSKPLLPSPDLQNLAMSLGIVTLWRWVSLWSSWHFGGASTTIAWALLGLVVFLIGLLFREPMYRWLGWGLLIAATLRVVLVDIHDSAGAVVLDLAVIGSIMLVAAFSEGAVFGRFLRLARLRT